MTNSNAKIEACKTYLEQTKLLVTLSSAFVVAPAVLFEKMDFFNGLSIAMEVCFVLSVLIGYVVFGSISGTQNNGNYDVYNWGTRFFSLLQIGLFLAGLILLIINFQSGRPTKSKDPEHAKCDTVFLRPPFLVDQVFRLNNVLFDFNSYSLKPESHTELQKLVDTLRKYPNLVTEIGAHTDNVGSETYNLTLSEKRAEAVVRYLTSQNIPYSQVEPKGYGELKPISLNNTDIGRQINRRVELRIIKVFSK